MNKFLGKLLLFFLLLETPSLSDKIDNIKILGNERISKETILMFSDISLNDKIDDKKINQILKNLYESNFFDDISVEYDQNTLSIIVKELPIIQNIFLDGIKASKFKEEIKKNFKLKSRSSFNEFFLGEEVKIIKSTLKNYGYYFADVSTYVEALGNNMVNITYKIDLGEKAKIKKISFVGNKIFKDKELKNLIVSEEYKFWKFVSSKKYLNEDLIKFDNNLIRNFYLNKGFYNVEVNSSFAKLINNDEFEIIYSINPGEKIYFGDVFINLPKDVDESNYQDLKQSFEVLRGEPYSINTIEKILKEIDTITVNQEFKSIKSSVEEKIVSNTLNLIFKIDDLDKMFVEQINIFGNNITEESVIRNQLALDEGDPFNEILLKKSENSIKSLNFFKKVNTNVSEETVALALTAIPLPK